MKKYFFILISAFIFNCCVFAAFDGAAVKQAAENAKNSLLQSIDSLKNKAAEKGINLPQVADPNQLLESVKNQATSVVNQNVSTQIENAKSSLKTATDKAIETAKTKSQQQANPSENTQNNEIKE